MKLLVIFFWHFSSNRKIWSSQWICFSEQLVCCVYLKLLRAIYSIRVTNSNSTICCKIWLAMYASEQPEGNIFVLFVLTELPQWWNHVQVSRKKFKKLVSKAKGKYLRHSQMCAYQQNFIYSSKKCAGLHTIKITDCIKSGSLNTCLFNRKSISRKTTHHQSLHLIQIESSNFTPQVSLNKM